jgi:ketosteroid isomerase-like protein
MHPNEAALRAASDAISSGDLETFLSHYADDVLVHYPGSSPLAGDHHGKEAFLAVFGRFAEITGSPPQIAVHDVVANDEHGVVLQMVHIERKGRSLDAQQVVVSHFLDGKVREIWPNFLDQQAVDEMLG